MNKALCICLYDLYKVIYTLLKINKSIYYRKTKQFTAEKDHNLLQKKLIITKDKCPGKRKESLMALFFPIQIVICPMSKIQRE